MRKLPTTAPLWLLSAACLLLVARPGTDAAPAQEDDFAWTTPVEPALRVRVVLGEEQLELALGSTTSTSDGRPLTVALEPTRRLTVPGAFTLDYPHAWRFSGAGGANGAWAYLAGDRAALQLRWHRGDARAALDELVTNLEHTFGSTRSPDRLTLDRRELEGFAVATRSAAIGAGYREQAWRQRAFAFEDRAGRAWLFVLHECAEPSELPAYLPSITLDLVSPMEDAEEPEAAPDGPLDALVESFRWDA